QVCPSNIDKIPQWTPFPEMVINTLRCQCPCRKKRSYGQVFPLHTCLHLVKGGIGKLGHLNPRRKTAPGCLDVGYNFYYMFVEYFVQGLWNLCSATKISVALSFVPKKV